MQSSRHCDFGLPSFEHSYIRSRYDVDQGRQHDSISGNSHFLAYPMPIHRIGMTQYVSGRVLILKQSKDFRLAYFALYEKSQLVNGLRHWCSEPENVPIPNTVSNHFRFNARLSSLQPGSPRFHHERRPCHEWRSPPSHILNKLVIRFPFGR